MVGIVHQLELEEIKEDNLSSSCDSSCSELKETDSDDE